jgi:(R)-benzylsuccinyl-CoA dehydrogenase
MPYARGEKRASLALTEPGAGSDVAAIRTVAERRSGGWSLRGTKRFISWADTADFFIVIAVTDREKRAREGMTAFLVDRAAPGLEIGPHAATMGEPTPYELMLDDCFVPDELILGEVGNAFGPLTKRLGLRRVEMGARSIGMGERLVEMMVSYAHDRSTFGSPLADRQIVQSWIADSVIEIHATRLMVRDAAEKIDAGTGGHRLEASAVKVFGTDLRSSVTTVRRRRAHQGTANRVHIPQQSVYANHGRAVRDPSCPDSEAAVTRVAVTRPKNRVLIGKMTVYNCMQSSSFSGGARGKQRVRRRDRVKGWPDRDGDDQSP